MSPVTDNPFAVLTLVVAPAVLTNASSVLSLATGNRLGRVIDRAREISKELRGHDLDEALRPVRMRQLDRLQKRAAMLLQTLKLLYAALGSFAAAVLTSALGAVFSASQYRGVFRVFSLLALVAGFAGVGALVAGSSVLVRETRLGVANLTDELLMVQSARPAPHVSASSAQPTLRP